MSLPPSGRPSTEEAPRLSGQMVGYLVNFARSCDPNGTGLPTWEAAAPGSRNVLWTDLPAPKISPLPDTAQTGVFGW